MQKNADKFPKKCGKSSKKAQHRSKKVQQKSAAKGCSKGQKNPENNLFCNASPPLPARAYY